LETLAESPTEKSRNYQRGQHRRQFNHSLMRPMQLFSFACQQKGAKLIKVRKDVTYKSYGSMIRSSHFWSTGD